MSVRYKFKNDLEYTTLSTDGLHISVRDLKKAIVVAKKLGHTTDFDLVVTDSTTDKVFANDNDLINKNTTLIVARHPLPSGQKRVWIEEEKARPKATKSSNATPAAAIFANKDNLTEDDKLSNMMANSTEMYDQKNWVSYRGRASYAGQRAPASYRCNRCHKSGHWIHECPTNPKPPPSHASDFKRTTGIPRSFLQPATSATPGAKLNPQGLYMVNTMEEKAYSETKVDKPVWDKDDTPLTKAAVDNSLKIPDELKCPVCNDLLRDAVMMPCCAGCMCDECARDALIKEDNTKNECPLCGEADNSPDDLIPVRQTREEVKKFLNSNRHFIQQAPKEAKPAMEPPPSERSKHPVERPTLPDIPLPDLSTADGKFDTVAFHNSQKREEQPPGLGPGPFRPTPPGSKDNSPVYGDESPDISYSPIDVPGDRAEDEAAKADQSDGTPPPATSPTVATPPPDPDEGREADKEDKEPAGEDNPGGEVPDMSRPPPGFKNPSVGLLPTPTSLPVTLPTSLPTHAPPANYPPPLMQQPIYGRGPPRHPRVIDDPLDAFESYLRKKDNRSKYGGRGRYGGRPRSRSRSPPPPPYYHRHPGRRRSPPGPYARNRYSRYSPPARYRDGSPPHHHHSDRRPLLHPRGPRTPPSPPRDSATPPPRRPDTPPRRSKSPGGRWSKSPRRHRSPPPPHRTSSPPKRPLSPPRRLSTPPPGESPPPPVEKDRRYHSESNGSSYSRSMPSEKKRYVDKKPARRSRSPSANSADRTPSLSPEPDYNSRKTHPHRRTPSPRHGYEQSRYYERFDGGHRRQRYMDEVPPAYNKTTYREHSHERDKGWRPSKPAEHDNKPYDRPPSVAPNHRSSRSRSRSRDPRNNAGDAYDNSESRRSEEPKPKLARLEEHPEGADEQRETLDQDDSLKKTRDKREKKRSKEKKKKRKREDGSASESMSDSAQKKKVKKVKKTNRAKVKPDESRGLKKEEEPGKVNGHDEEEDHKPSPQEPVGKKSPETMDVVTTAAAAPVASEPVEPAKEIQEEAKEPSKAKKGNDEGAASKSAKVTEDEDDDALAVMLPEPSRWERSDEEDEEKAAVEEGKKDEDLRQVLDNKSQKAAPVATEVKDSDDSKEEGEEEDKKKKKKKAKKKAAKSDSEDESAAARKAKKKKKKKEREEKKLRKLLSEKNAKLDPDIISGLLAVLNANSKDVESSSAAKSKSRSSKRSPSQSPDRRRRGSRDDSPRRGHHRAGDSPRRNRHRNDASPRRSHRNNSPRRNVVAGDTIHVTLGGGRGRDASPARSNRRVMTKGSPVRDSNSRSRSRSRSRDRKRSVKDRLGPVTEKKKKDKPSFKKEHWSGDRKVKPGKAERNGDRR